jgi:excisionase family DNA binding protein
MFTSITEDATAANVDARASGEGMPKDKSDGEILTVSELADYMRVHSTTIYRLLKLGGFPAFKIGSDWRFKRTEIDKWIAAQQR